MLGTAEAAFDLFVVGGGINGVGIARDAVGRGLSVALAEQDDLASATSSASSKLIHGGLRYLEYYEFRLVREALAEREVLLGIAPHIIWPLRFVLPHRPHLRPVWMIRAGLFLYDRLGGRGTLPRSQGLRLPGHALGAGLKAEFGRGFAYSDCWVDDARLVVLNARGAADAGALIMTRTECVGAARTPNGLWRVALRSRRDGTTRDVYARALVNAAGPWVLNIAERAAGARVSHSVRLVKGSHIVVPRLYEGSHAYILQNADRRVVFVLPYEDVYSLIGTTDLAYTGDPATVAISGVEIDYLCRTASEFMARALTPADVVWSYSGVRPLYDDGREDPSAVTRDYVLDLSGGEGEAPLLSVYGGKITTYRRLAEHALEKLKTAFPRMAPAWTHAAPLPGGELGGSFETFLAELAAERPGLAPTLLRRLARRHGARVRRLLGEAERPEHLGRHFGGDLFEAEVRFMMDEEWAETAEDILWRRSKAGLHLDVGERAALADYVTRRAGTPKQAAPAASAARETIQNASR